MVPLESLEAEVAQLEARLQAGELFAVFGVPPAADVATVRKAFFGMCRRLHPDRHFRRDLGPLRARLEQLFKNLLRAHETLTTPARRQAYLDANPHLTRPPPPPRARGQRVMLTREELEAAKKAGR